MHRAGQGGRQADRGAVLIEFSIVFALFAFIVYALVAFGMAMNLKANLTHAVEEGARAAIGAGGACDLTTSACVTQKRQAAIDRTKGAVGGQSQTVRDEVRRAIENTAANRVQVAPCASPPNPGVAPADPNAGVAAGAGPYCMFVDLPYDYSAHPIVPSAPGLGIVMPNTLHSAGVVQLTNS